MSDSTTTSLQDQLSAQRATSPAPLRAAGDAQVAALRADDAAARAAHTGDQAPTFTLPDALGRPVSLAEALAHGPVVLTFYRGEWCPYCNLQLHAYQDALPQFTALGAQLIAISPQTPDHSLSTQEKHNLTFAVLSDAGNQVARHYGLVFAADAQLKQLQQSRGMNLATYNGDDSWELPMPGTFVIAPNGTIHLAVVNFDYRERVEPTVIVQALRELREGE